MRLNFGGMGNTMPSETYDALTGAPRSMRPLALLRGALPAKYIKHGERMAKKTSGVSVRAQLEAACHRLDALRYTPGSSGNVSARADGKHFLITPSGSWLGRVKAREFLSVDMTGRCLMRGGKPSVETQVHLAIYKARPDVNAVLHAHPPACVGYCIAERDFGKPCNLEVYAALGSPVMVPFAPPGDTRFFMERLQKADCFFLAKHGVFTLGATVDQALHRMEQMENYAQALAAAGPIGGGKPFTKKELDAIHAFMARLGIALPRGSQAQR